MLLHVSRVHSSLLPSTSPLCGRNTVGLLSCFPGGTVVKNPPARQETQVRSLGREDRLE